MKNPLTGTTGKATPQNRIARPRMLPCICAAATALAALHSPAAVDALPEGYTRLEWIAPTNGAPHVDTDYTPEQTDKISVRFLLSKNTGSEYQALYCARDANKGNTFSCIVHSSGMLRFDYNEGARGYTSVLSRPSEIILDAEGGTGTQSYAINGNVLSGIESKEGEFTVGSTLHLFATPTGELPGRSRIYWFQVRDSAGTLKVDLRPCLRESDGAVGMYDLVRERFLPGVGTGAFDANDTGLPAGYGARKWIETDGTQWINTQFTPLCFDTVSMSFRFREQSDDFRGLFCARGANNTNTFTCIKSNKANGNNNRFRFDRKGGTIGYSASSSVADTDYTISMKGSTGECKVNGATVPTSGNGGNFTVGSPIVLFAMHQNAANMTYMSSLRLYCFTVTDSDTGIVLCDLLPCARSSDGKPGLYDRINKRFLANGGTGEFKTSEYAFVISVR